MENAFMALEIVEKMPVKTSDLLYKSVIVITSGLNASCTCAGQQESTVLTAHVQNKSQQ